MILESQSQKLFFHDKVRKENVSKGLGAYGQRLRAADLMSGCLCRNCFRTPVRIAAHKLMKNHRNRAVCGSVCRWMSVSQNVMTDDGFEKTSCFSRFFIFASISKCDANWCRIFQQTDCRPDFPLLSEHSIPVFNVVNLLKMDLIFAWLKYFLSERMKRSVQIPFELGKVTLITLLLI